ncbi:MAG TPA: oligosaccharide flippase family protein, partial [Bacteroidales bacterium]|nr:oligosaccharide flippase family protein [Bacteroidales bacterium]
KAREYFYNFVANITNISGISPRMQRKFLTNLCLLLFLNLLVKPFWIFGIDRTVQNTVGPSDYGFYFVVFNFSFLFSILLDMGITNFNNRNIAQNNQLLNKHFSGIITMKFMLGVFYSLVTFIVAVIWGFKGDRLPLLALLCFNQFLSSLVLYLRSNISGLLMFKTDSMLSVLDRMLMILFCGMLLWGHVTDEPFRIEWFVYSQTAAYLLTALTALAIVIKKANFRRPRWNWPFFLMIMKQSFPFALLSLLMTLYNRLDPVMIDKLLPASVGTEQVGIYASGFRLLDAANMIAFLFSVILLPIFSRMIKNKDSVKEMMRLSFTILITVAIIVSVGSFFYSYPLMDLLYDSHVENSARVFQVLMLGFIAVSATYIFGTLLTANGSMLELNIVSLVGLFINLGINFWLIPKMMAVGSAYASLVTQFVTALLQVLIVMKVFRFRPDYLYMGKLLAYTGGVVLFNYISLHIKLDMPGLSANYSWLPGFTMAILFSFLLAVALRLLSFRSLMNIVRPGR